jgi:hypothetical protein
MTYSECSIDFGPLCRSPHLYDADYFDMNESWIVRVYQKEQTVVVRNRWTLEIVDVSPKREMHKLVVGKQPLECVLFYISGFRNPHRSNPIQRT